MPQAVGSSLTAPPVVSQFNASLAAPQSPGNSFGDALENARSSGPADGKGSGAAASATKNANPDKKSPSASSSASAAKKLAGKKSADSSEATDGRVRGKGDQTDSANATVTNPDAQAETDAAIPDPSVNTKAGKKPAATTSDPNAVLPAAAQAGAAASNVAPNASAPAAATGADGWTAKARVRAVPADSRQSSSDGTDATGSQTPAAGESQPGGEPSATGNTTPTSVPTQNGTTAPQPLSPARARAAGAAKAGGRAAAADFQTTASDNATATSDASSAGASLAPDDTTPIEPNLNADSDPTPSPSVHPLTRAADGPKLTAELVAGGSTSAAGPSASPRNASPADATAATPQAQFAQANHANIVSGIQARLLPNGGSMQLRLDPPELGPMMVRVEVRDGSITASFETSNDQATKMLSHSLGDLKSALEAQGVTIAKLHVTQSTAKPSSSSSGDNSGQDSSGQQSSASQQEQQRKEMVRRMWQKLMGGQDPLDLVA